MSKYYTDHQLFYVNSYKRITGDNQNFSYMFDIDKDIAYDHVVVLDASIAKSYYNMQTTYNTFTLVQGSTNYIITIPAANYTRTSMCSALTTLLNAVSSWVYSISFQNIALTGDTGQLTFTVTGNDSQPKFIFSSNSPYEQLVFNSNTTYTFNTNTLTSPNVINLAQESTLFISSNMCQNKTDSILCNIVTPQDSSFSYVVYNCPCPYEYSKNFVGNNSNTFTFRLQDENSNEINLNGLNMVFTVMLYKSNKIDQLIKGYIKYAALKDGEVKPDEPKTDGDVKPDEPKTEDISKPE